jgi:hypothetical protein
LEIPSVSSKAVKGFWVVKNLSVDLSNFKVDGLIVGSVEMSNKNPVDAARKFSATSFSF